MKTRQSGARLLIATGSAAAFLGGWALLAHTAQPATTESTGPTASLPAIDWEALTPRTGDVPQLQSLPVLPRTLPQAQAPFRLRTSGS